VSRQILLLEDELSEQLFLRVGGKIRITPAGTALLGAQPSRVSRTSTRHGRRLSKAGRRLAAPSGSSAA
jgi:DNA-binding transcriptional LysR family regulator